MVAHQAPDLLQAVVRGMDVSRIDGKCRRDVGPAVGNAPFAEQSPEFPVDAPRRSLGAFLGGAVHIDIDPPPRRQAFPGPAPQGFPQFTQGSGIVLDRNQAGFFPVLRNSFPFQRLLQGHKPAVHGIRSLICRMEAHCKQGHPESKGDSKKKMVLRRRIT